MKSLKVSDDLHKLLRVRAATNGESIQVLAERILRGDEPTRLDAVMETLRRAAKPAK
jgi:plasmid stability protein